MLRARGGCIGGIGCSITLAIWFRPVSRENEGSTIEDAPGSYVKRAS